MKKLLTWFAIILILFFLIVYAVIPATIEVRTTSSVYCTKRSANLVLSNYQKWQQWFPTNNKTNLVLNNFSYHPVIPANNSYTVFLKNNNDSLESHLFVLPGGKDSSSISWSCTLPTSYNPFQRIKNYFQANRLAQDFKTLFDTLKPFLENTKNIYDIGINKSKVKDTLLVTTNQHFNHPPTTQEIYTLIDKLHNVIKLSNAAETNFPMLHISMIDSNDYATQVAIPINTLIKESENISLKRMVPGNILISDDIYGGEYSVAQAFKKMEIYVTDFKKIVPAIPFQSLVTNRMQQTDTSKWITRIYYPVY